jgi:hypothetical protein
MFIWMRRHIQIFRAAGLSMAFMLSPPLLHSASLSTPDMMSGLVLLCACYSFIERKALFGGYVLLLLAVFTRIDNIIPAALITAFLAGGRKWHAPVPPVRFLLMSGGLVAAYLIVAYSAHRYGWSLLYFPTFYANHHDTFYSIRGSSLWRDFVLQRYSAIMICLQHYHLFIYLGFSLLLFIRATSFRWNDFSFDQAFMLTLISILLIRMLIYTDHGDRHFIAWFVLIPILLVKRFMQLPAHRTVPG